MDVAVQALLDSPPPLQVAAARVVLAQAEEIGVARVYPSDLWPGLPPGQIPQA